MRKIKQFEDFINELVVGSIPIPDINRYLEGMTKGISDKFFFLKIINPDFLVDFGCADGYILNYLKRLKPDIETLGYDKDELMIEKAKEKYPEINFTDDWNEVMYLAEDSKYQKRAIFLSSVIHEVYSYSTSREIQDFWKNKVFNDNFDYVIIRDMIPSIIFEKMISKDVNKVREKSDPVMLKQFEDIWGRIDDNFRTLLHWLLKYRYVQNWKRELKENYLPVTLEHLKVKIPSDWKIIYEKHYTYDFVRDHVKKDFDIDLEEPTHLKMILKRI